MVGDLTVIKEILQLKGNNTWFLLNNFIFTRLRGLLET